MIQKQTLAQFQKELSSKNATPGGGVVAALSAQFSASLIEMVCNLTKDDILIATARRAREIKKRLEKLAEEDAKAFSRVMEAYRISKDDPKRNDLIKKALKYAIEVPLEVKKFAEELIKLAEHAGKVGNKNAHSDAKTAVHMAHAASRAAMENVKINKESLKKLI